MPIGRFLSAGLVCLAVLPARSAAQVPERTRAPAPERTITAAAIRGHIEVLSADSMKGRQTPGPGLEAAARHAAAVLTEAGLRPVLDTWEQRFPLEFSRLQVAGVRLTVVGREGARSLTYGEDFIVVPARVQHGSGPLVYFGEATSSPMQLPRETAGAVVVFTIPGPIGRAWNERAKQVLAAATRARSAGFLIVLDSVVPTSVLAGLRSSLERELVDLEAALGALVRPEAMAPVFAAAGLDFAAWRARPAGTFAPVPLQGVAELDQPLQVRRESAPNVLALLPGSDPRLRSEVIVLSAHLDHVGTTPTANAAGDSIYNGADDDASGVAAVLEVARALAASPPARSVLFALFSAEERGLRGSRHFVAHPPVPLANVRANVNVDMIGRNAPDSVALIGQEQPRFAALLANVTAQAGELGLQVAAGNPWPELPLSRMGDHLPFAEAGVPALLVTTGPHADLHGTGDEVGRLDADKAARVTRLVARLVRELADERPQYRSK